MPGKPASWQHRKRAAFNLLCCLGSAVLPRQVHVQRASQLAAHRALDGARHEAAASVDFSMRLTYGTAVTGAPASVAAASGGAPPRRRLMVQDADERVCFSDVRTASLQLAESMHGSTALAATQPGRSRIPSLSSCLPRQLLLTSPLACSETLSTPSHPSQCAG